MEHVNNLCKQDAELLILMEMIHIAPRFFKT